MRKIGIASLLLLFLSLPADAQYYTRVGQLSESFHCTMISTATALTTITGCGVVTGKSYYITDLTWSSSIISTTTNYFLLRSGTAANCGSNTVSLFSDFGPSTFSGRSISFTNPIKATVSHGLCFIHPGAGTRNINIEGFIQ